MVVQLLTPGVEDRQKANVGPEMLRIPRDGDEGLGDRLEEEGIEEAGVVEGEAIERVGQGKDHMEVRHREEFALPRSQPGGLGRALTLGTVPIPTGVIGDCSSDSESCAPPTCPVQRLSGLVSACGTRFSDHVQGNTAL